MKRWQRWGMKGLLGMGLWLAGAPLAWGQLTTWTNTSGGAFTSAANWDNGAPTPAGTALFQTVTGSYTVTFSSNPTSHLVFNDGNVTFNLLGHNYTSAVTAELGSSQLGTNGRLTIINGTVSAPVAFAIVSGGNGSLTVSTQGVWDTGGTTTNLGNLGSGALTVNNGGNFTTSALVLGSTTTGIGTLSVSGTGSSLNMTTFTVGSNGSGTATISGGATATATSTATIANLANSNGSMIVTGNGSALNLSNTLNIGNAAGAVGSMTISSSGVVTNTSSAIGNNATATGAVTVTGTGSTWTNSGGLSLGDTGKGTLSITNGGIVSALSVTLGQTSGGNGAITISGVNSTLASTTNLLIGVSGSTAPGTMTMGTGAIVTAGGTTFVNTNGTLTMEGGTFDTVGFTRNGSFIFNDGTLHVRGAYNANPSLSALVINGNDDTALPTLRLSGNFTTSNVSSLTVGSTHQGAVILDTGRNVSLGANSISLGTTASGSGSVTVNPGSSLSNTSTIDVGGTGGASQGAGTLTINGGSVFTNTLNLHPLGVVNLNGILSANTIFANGGRMNFNSGLLNINSGVALTGTNLDAILGTVHVLGAGRELDVNGVAAISAPMTISGGLFFTNGTTNDSIFQIDSGIASASTFTNNAGRLIVVSGTGSLIGNTAIANNGTLQLNNNLVPTTGGTLTNTGIIRGTGYVGNNLTNGTAGQVQVTTGNRLEFQGSANTNSGLISLVGGEVVFTGPVTNSANTGLISGRDAILRTGGITNNGSLAFSNGTMDVFGDITQNVGGRITISGGGNVNFYDDVTIAPGAASVQASAAGGTVSKVVFFGSYNGGVTGGGTAFIEGDHRPGNSPGLVTFGGDVFYGGLSRLFIELGGKNRGTQYDAIDVTGSVTVSGELILTHINSFNTIGGETFLLINNDGTDAINGTFNNLPEGATFLADNHLFQVSYIGGTGNDFTLTAVPEPTTWALIALGGVAAIGYGYRRLRQRQAAADLIID